MFDQKEYEELFFKDNRNLKGGPREGKKRGNLKETLKRNIQIEKRAKQSQADEMKQQCSQQSSIDESRKMKRYDNGKPIRVQKPIVVFVDESPQKTETKKRQRKNRKI